MKRSAFLSKTLVVFSLFLLINSCFDYTITTKIHPDGSIDRLIKVSRTDSGTFESGSLFVPVDSTWHITTDWKDTLIEGDSAKLWVMTAFKHFNSYEDLNREMRDTSGIHKIGDSIRLEKKFRWFYTYITFTETFKKYFPFDHIPVDSFLTMTEMDFIINTDDYYYSAAMDSVIKKENEQDSVFMQTNDTLLFKKYEEKVNRSFLKWQAENAFEELEMIFSEGLGDYYSGDSLQYLKDSLYSIIEKHFFLGDPESYPDPVSFLARELKTDSATLYNMNKEKLDDFYEKMNHLFDATSDNYHISMIMPGLLTASNSDDISGNQANWEIRLDHFYARDYVMYAESRIINKWAVVFSILVLALFSGGLVLSFIRRKKEEV